MPTWNDILNEIQSTAKPTPNGIVIDYDYVRRKYIKDFSNYRNRNVIVYYSDWLQQGKKFNLDINDGDMVGFMNAVHGLDKTKGLDLIIPLRAVEEELKADVQAMIVAGTNPKHKK